MNAVILLALLLPILNSQIYKEFKLTRSRVNRSSSQPSNRTAAMPNAFEELSYEKDVSYRTELYIDDSIYYVSMDLTVPYSWLKSPLCKEKDHPNCHLIQDAQKKEAENNFKDIRTKFQLFNRHDDFRLNDVAIFGSSDLIVGELQKVEYAEFYARDSRSTKELAKLIGISLFLSPEKDRISLANVSLVKAEKLSQGVNELIDGAISLKPTQNTSNNFLQQLFTNIHGSGNRIVTMLIRPISKTGIVSIGDLSLKYTRSKPSEIVWLSMKEHPTFGFSCTSTGVALKNNRQGAPTRHLPAELKSTKSIFVTFSSSNIFLPRDMLDWLVQSLKQSTNSLCAISEKTQLLNCHWKDLEDKKKAIFLTASFHFAERTAINIPMTTLISVSEALFIEFTIKESQSPERIILGQPFFEEYLVFLDYGAKKLAFLPAFYHQSDRFGAILIYFLRFLLLGSLLLFILFICFKPFGKALKFLRTRLAKFKRSKHQHPHPSFSELGDSEPF